MKILSYAFSAFGVIITLGGLGLPSAAGGAIDYTGKIIVKDGGGATLGYLQEDPNYWTPEITADPNSALIVSFTLNGTSGTQINLAVDNSGQGYPYLGLVEGRDSTSANIGSGNFNYLYLDGTDGTNPGATPQLVPNYFATTNSLSKPGESAVWDIDVNALTLIPVWVNTDSSTPTTVTFAQSNHVYAGGDADAFHTRFPAPVTSTALFLDITSAVAETPEPASLCTFALGALGLTMLRLRKGNRS